MDNEMSYGEDYKAIPATSIGSGVGVSVLPDLFCYTVQIVNVCLFGDEESNDFVLIDAGMPNSAEEIIKMTEDRYGVNSRPRAIILTHGHFDHVGAILELINYWDVPVYAHELEIPYLTGKKSYPKPDPSVEGGLIAKFSGLFPNEPINITGHVKALPENNSVPHMPGFRWVHTPGHTAGHVSFFREKDRVLIAGDAFVTVKQDALYKVFTQEIEISGPPRYLTPDWEAARRSVEQLAKLKPSIVVTGHGQPVSGEELTKGLKKLVDNFETVAIPDYGKYLN
ncbi:MBL fold metallo-hydrolase [Paraliobacillus zengyii]|uniref:MBL fold metallo-hydrolase n=1 Tax=Paraliobacillus zengyii TaxID=2213194 RepID=UPI000DD41E6E|nr:MBL fold metallo-hydrolase [Paraliobacillus zengyii]